MLKIAICDDSLGTCSDIEKTIINYGKDSLQKFSIDIFYMGKELVQSMDDDNVYDVIFLDIELGDMTGIEVGRLIREEMDNNLVQIVYISSSQDYAMELFRNRPMNFLVKPVQKNDIIRSIELVIKLTENYNNTIEFTIGKKFYKIMLKNIIYFECDGRKMKAITTKKTYEYYGKISDTLKQVPNNEFLHIHRSFIVNYAYITEIHSNQVLLTTGEILPISQGLKADVRKELIKRRLREKI